METGAIMKTAFCGPCFGAGDTPANNAFSIRHSTRNFPNREGSKVQNGQIASVALMDARSIAATAANKGYLTPATEMEGRIGAYKYHFDSNIYKNRVFDSKGVADPSVEIKFGPNIKDWPKMCELPNNLVLRVVSEIHDPVTTTDELIPSGETSSFRSNPLGLAEFTLSRRDPAYVGRAKAVRDGSDEVKAEVAATEAALAKAKPEFKGRAAAAGRGSSIFAGKPGDGSAREQAASCQKVLGGDANICYEYATKRYRSNCINWGIVPFTIAKETPFDYEAGDFVYVPGIREAIISGKEEIDAQVITKDGVKPIHLFFQNLTNDERTILEKGCLMNYYKSKK
jgi:aconitate hydratase